MNIKVYRGTHQIGGCVTEYEYQGRHLFVDYGEELPGGPQTGDLQVEGLTYGDISKSALLITHYHGDHIGCIPKLPKDLPIFMGRISRDIQMELSNRLQMVDVFHRNMSERLKTVHTFEPGRPFSWGSFHIMPVTVDHSAFDAYAFKVEAGGVSVFHTGDFRTHGLEVAGYQMSSRNLLARWIMWSAKQPTFLVLLLPVNLSMIYRRSTRSCLRRTKEMLYILHLPT